MGPIEENGDLESDEEIPFNTSQATRKVHSFDFEATDIEPHENSTKMGPIEENGDLESDEEIPFNTSQATRKVHSFDFEATDIEPHENSTKMGTIEENGDLESNEEIPFNTSQATKKVHSFDFEANDIEPHENNTKMGPIEENGDLESNEEIPFNTSQATRKVHSFSFEANDIEPHENNTKMGPIEENGDLESNEEIPFNTSQATRKVHSFDFEATHIGPHVATWIYKQMRIRPLKSIYVVLIKAKINMLLPFGPLAILLHYLTKKHGWVLFFSLLGMTPLAERLGYATEQLAFYTGPTVGGLLNAIFGNVTDMIISIYALKKGMIRVVQQSLLGSILSNMLLVLGCAFFTGGIVHYNKVQVFDKAAALVNSPLLLMAAMGIMFPAVLYFTHTEVHFGKSELALSRFSSCIMLVAYASYLFFHLSQRNLPVDEEQNNDEEEAPEITHWEAIGWLFVLTAWVSILSGYLVDAIPGASDSMNIPVAFISIILLPIVEHAHAIMFAMKDKLDNTLGVAIGSSTQISMFVIPFCVVVGWCMGKEMDLNFQVFETATLFIAVLIVTFMLQEGTSNYFKGLMLILCYLIVAARSFVHVDNSTGRALDGSYLQ